MQLKPAPETSPIQQFIKKHQSRPQITALQTAIATDDGEAIRQLTQMIGQEGWRQFLNTVRRSNTRAFYAYLANADGRRKWGLTPAETAPILQGDKVLILNQDKCEALALAFYKRMQAPAILNPEGHYTHPEDKPLGPFRGRIEGGHDILTHTEVIKAIEGLAIRKAPGPDGLPFEV